MEHNPQEYQPNLVEKKWQEYWLKNKSFKTPDRSDKPKYYVLDMFPYPSGSGLHVGHPEGYTATDIVARFKRMKGFNVLHPMGWDAFGLPAEQHAVKTGTHPRDTTKANIDNFRRQIQSIGLSYDWDREINTTDTSYYKWTQWIFLQLYNRGLAYQAEQNVNWCEELGTVLANEEVIDGKSEVGGFPVIKRPMRQWILRITAYAERLLEDLEDLDWPESIKEMQRHWIGKSVGAEIDFAIHQHTENIKVFTTRPDTLFGATFCVLAPEHPVVAKICSPAQKALVEAYVQNSQHKADRERIATAEKTGVFTGAYAINPVNQEKIPIYIADYVLISYGHGAIMAVPAHDERDHEFARKYGLPIKQVLEGGEEAIEVAAFTGEGTLIHSGFLNGLKKSEAIEAMCLHLDKLGIGQKTVSYKLRDWLFSRQRYWGEPIPIAHDKDGNEIALSSDELPLILPDLDDFKPTKTAESPLAKAETWLRYEKNGKLFSRETNTMPQWAGSCWYYLRYIDPKNDHKAWDSDKERYWMPVDLYVGGVEHAVLHLLYSRFWHKVLYDAGLVSTKEPFQKLVNQGMILGENGEKMSKSRGNVVNPDEVIQQWGADAFRLYEMFMGPLEAVKPWKSDGLVGTHRFLGRFWRLLIGPEGQPSQTTVQPSDNFDRLLHKTIKKVTEDTEAMRFNTAVAVMMELVNAALKEPSIGADAAKTMICLLHPYAPHIAEELWSRYGASASLSYETWPSFDPARCIDHTITLSIQVCGKMRGTLEIPKNLDQASIFALAKKLDTVAKHLQDKILLKEIYVPGKIINFVVK
ncbi:MAG: leucine--tRNA ligase [Proteobacteria bacterium]|nr:leucine--tRNA ligase [Pseudomonadota bacterium]